MRGGFGGAKGRVVCGVASAFGVGKPWRVGGVGAWPVLVGGM